MQKFQRADWLRARQLIPNGAESWNWVQKVEIEGRKLKLNLRKVNLSRETVTKQNGGQVWGK